MDMLELTFVLAVWSSLGCAAFLVGNAWLLLRRGQTLGLLYFDLVVAAPSHRRVLLAEIAALTVPWLLGGLGAQVVFTTLGNDQELQLAVLLSIAMSCHALDWLYWLGPSERTLGDRLGGGRVQSLPPAPSRRLWPAALLVCPPAIVALAYAELRGVVIGGMVGTFVMAFPVAVRHLRK
jgi:hypothetical protein